VKLLFSIPLLWMAFVINAADAKTIKSETIYTYERSGFSTKPSAEEKSKALQQAKVDIWRVYTADFDASRMAQYLKVEQDLLADIDSFISNFQVLREDVNRRSQTITLLTRAKINEAAVTALLSKNSAAGQQASGEGSQFSFLFLTREAASAKSFLTKSTRINASETATTANETFTADTNSASETTSTESFSKKQSGGSDVIKKREVNYQVGSSQDVDTAIGEPLSISGFEIIGYDDVIGYCGGLDRSDVASEFAVSDDISGATRKTVISAMRECEIDYFALGTLDVGIPAVDPVSGNKKVFVSVRAQVWSLAKRLPRKVASIGPVQFSGLGPDEEVASNNALTLASQKAGQALVDQMNAKGIR
jgi:hypothetical protein